MTPWNDWYHCTEHTYGTWLRGDPRGWRARHHREHVDGDYKNPPPEGAYDKLLKHSKWLMKRDPVRIAHDRRQIVLTEIVNKLLELGIFVLAACLDGTHAHILARFPGHNPRHWLGIAKKHTSHMCRQFPDYVSGGLWAKRGHPEPVVDRRHQVSTVDYIARHARRGAAVYLAPQLKRRESLNC